MEVAFEQHVRFNWVIAFCSLRWRSLSTWILATSICYFSRRRPLLALFWHHKIKNLLLFRLSKLSFQSLRVFTTPTSPSYPWMDPRFYSEVIIQSTPRYLQEQSKKSQSSKRNTTLKLRSCVRCVEDHSTCGGCARTNSPVARYWGRSICNWSWYSPGHVAWWRNRRVRRYKSGDRIGRV